MKRITFNKFANMKVNEQRELLHNLDVAFSGCETITTAMSFAYNPWRTAYEDMVAAYDTSYKAPESDEIHTLDQMCDNLLASGHGVANGLSKSPDPEMAAAARDILQAYKSFKVVYSSSYISQKPQVDSLLYALLVTNRDSVVLCGLLPVYEKVKQFNDRMHELVEQRDQTSYDPQRTAKRETAVARCLDLFDYINGYWYVVLHMANVPADLEQFFITTDNIFKRYDRVLGLGSSSSGTTKPGGSEDVTDEEESETTTPPTTNPETPPTTEPETPPTTEPETPPTTEPETPGGENTDKVTVTFNFENGSTETREYPKGTILRPGGTNYPANTPGYNWSILNVTLNSDTNAWEVSEGDSGLD